MSLVKLKAFFETYDFPDGEFRLDQCSVITDQRKFVESHIKVLEANSGKKLFKPYYDRIFNYYKLIQKQDENK